MSFTITPIKAFSDNYIWALHTQAHSLVVDPGDAEPVLTFLRERKLSLDYILITHHHFDHTGGIEKLKKVFPLVEVYGPNNPKISGITHTLKENDAINLPEFPVEFEIKETPGHTLDHIVYVNHEFLFCGDTLFSGGCGRMFEGTPEVFYPSLQKLAALAPSTKVYCAHEYTQANMAFAMSIEQNNKALASHATWVKEQRNQDKITLPSTISKECEINPFLRCHKADVKQGLVGQGALACDSATDVDTFAALRKLKDNF